MKAVVGADKGRDRILKDVRLALRGKPDSTADDFAASSSPQPVRQESGIPGRVAQPADLIEQFESELARIGVHYHRAPTADSAAQYIEGICLIRNAKTAVGWEAEIIDEVDLKKRLKSQNIELITELSGAEFLSTAAIAEVGISGVDYALADTGSLVLFAAKGQARSISLLPPVHIAIVRPEQLLSGLVDLFPLVYGEYKKQSGDLSSAITFITGPSRTADIELKLVVGVHGPQQLHVILLEPQIL